MITIQLQGGLGNQMLQYAFGVATAQRLGVELQIDVTPLLYDKIRQYNLSLFSGVQEKIVTNSKPTVRERGLPYNQEVVDSIKDGDVLLGYFPTEKYFYHIRQDIAERFQPKQAMPDSAIESAIKIAMAADQSTMLTIRRTDYVTKQDFHGVLPMSYYRDAIKHLQSQGVNPIIFVFSDEPEWCKNNLDIGMPFEVLGTHDMTTALHVGREDVDLTLMSRCKHAITANSSFSWWGAWLGEVRHGGNKIITAPKQWFTTNTVDWKDIVPERWVKL